MPSEIRDIICPILHESPDRDNWSESPNIQTEVEDLLYGCPWFKVYDFIESISDFLTNKNKYLGTRFHWYMEKNSESQFVPT